MVALQCINNNYSFNIIIDFDSLKDIILEEVEQEIKPHQISKPFQKDSECLLAILSVDPILVLFLRLASLMHGTFLLLIIIDY